MFSGLFLPLPCALTAHDRRRRTHATKKEHAFLRIGRLGTLEEARQEDRETKLTSRCFLGGDPRLRANPHRVGFSTGQQKCRWGFLESCTRARGSRGLREGRRVLCTRGGDASCLSRKQKFGAKFTGCFGVYGRLLNLFEGVM